MTNVLVRQCDKHGIQECVMVSLDNFSLFSTCVYESNVLCLTIGQNGNSGILCFVLSQEVNLAKKPLALLKVLEWFVKVNSPNYLVFGLLCNCWFEK